ncbi:MAG: MFS transporter [Candidatus Theseobacter exili]|nr:MFS transporter [Candidatus Theseobacter exili]
MHADEKYFLKIKEARKKFAAMAAAYSLGVFNDNFFKQAAMLLAVGVGKEHFQGLATVVFTLPFLLFAAPAGWMADRFAKRNVILGAKSLELVAMLFGAAGIYFLSWPLVFIMLFIMALQSTIFSPALNGSIPELYPTEFVATANARIRVIVTAAILFGIAVAGYLLDQTTGIFSSLFSAEVYGRFLVAVSVVTVSVLGVIVSFGVARFKAADPHAKFPKRGPVDTVNKLISLRSDPMLFMIIIANMFFWFLASLQVQIINVLGAKQLDLSKSVTSGLIVSQLIGVAIGGMLAVRFSKGKHWYRVLVPSMFCMAVGMALLCCISIFPHVLQVVFSFVLLGFIGIAGGVFLIPIESFIQIRPSSTEKGTVWASANFAAFSGIMLSGPFFVLMTWMRFWPTDVFGVMSVISFCLGIWMLGRLPKKGNLCVNAVNGLVARLAQRVLGLRYEVRINGLDEILDKDTKNILLLPNHPALIEPPLLVTAIYPFLAPRVLADETQINRPFIKWFSKRIGVLPIPDIKKSGVDGRIEVEEALNKIVMSLNRGDNFLLYPSGSVLRSRYEDIGANSAVEVILRKSPGTRVVLVRTKGLWGSKFSWASGKEPLVFPILIKGIWKLVLNGIFFGPRRKVEIELFEPKDLPVNEERGRLNRYMEDFFNAVSTPNTYVPYSIWERGGIRIIPEPEMMEIQGDPVEVSEGIKSIVFEHLKDLTGIPDFTVRDKLVHDIGLDSISRIDLLLWIENEFGVPQYEPDSLRTVGDVLLACSGQTLSKGPVGFKTVSKQWYRNTAGNSRLEISEGSMITDVFLKIAQQRKNQIIICDQLSGEKTYLDIVTAIMLLKPYIESLSGKYIGILLPAGVAAAITYFSTLFAGKIPVMINWTAGQRNIKHTLSLLNIKCIISADMFIKRLESLGTDISVLKSSIMLIEEVIQSVSLVKKVLISIRARVSWKSLYKSTVQKEAVVLFTSGSENLPKAVPLSHDNLLANVRDSAEKISIYENDRLLGMLPPFHSFGLTGDIIMPVCLGVPVVYYPNPTEGGVLSRLVEFYKTTLILGTPTFLSGIVKAASSDQLKSLRLTFTGAEKCTDSIYMALEKKCPWMLVVEGYGITECSPVISINDEKEPLPGTIGRVLSSLEYVVVHADTNKRVGYGNQGILLVRGPSVFSGYINYDGPSPFVFLDGKEWYRTGDLVVESKDGILSFQGRLKRFVKIGGEMISLPAIESVLKKYFSYGIEEGPVLAVEATSDEIHPELILFTTMDIDRAAVNKTIQDAGLSPIHNIRHVKKIESIPVLGTGKTDYRLLKESIR